MPIQFACEHCQKNLKVRDELAGKRIKCPQCQNATTVPTGGAAAGAPDAWYLQTEDGETYGPVPRAELDAWAKEGRVTASCQVLREGADQWQWATDVYPHLAEQPSQSPQSAGSAGQAPSSPAAPSAPAPQTSTGQQTGGSGAFDFGAASQPAKKEAGPFDFAPSETSGAPAPAFDFGADAGRRGRAKGGKSDKAAATSQAPAAGGSSAEPSNQPGYPPGVQPSAAPSQSPMKTAGRMQRITKVGILSLAKVMGVSGALMGLVIGIPYGLIVILISLAGFASEGGAGIGAMGVGFGLLVMIGFPLFYGVGLFIFGLIYGLILNLVLGLTGGLEIELQ